MYNRYIPANLGYTRVMAAQGTDGPGCREGKQPLPGLPLGHGESLEGIRSTLSGLFKRFHPEKTELGDLLLALILLLLILEDGDELDVAITLGVMFLFSLSGS